MKSKLLALLVPVMTFPVISHAESPYFSLKSGKDFKRFSVSAGWLHAMPQGSANPVNVGTAAINGKYDVGEVRTDTVTEVIANTPEGNAQKDKLINVVNLGKTIGLIDRETGTLTPDMSGNVQINSLESWQNPETGLEAQDVDTLGIMLNYHITDHWSFEIKAGIPPKVDISGKGQINAPLQGISTPVGNIKGDGIISDLVAGVANNLINGIGDIPLDSQIPVTNLSQSKSAATARAWLPAAEIHYQFGKSGVNKFRPYVGVGVMYAYFDKVKLDGAIENDLITAGHMIYNILDNKAGAALEKKLSAGNPVVNVKASDTFAPIATLGATYDFNQNWFAVGSVSYAKMNNEATINVIDQNTGMELINSKTKIDIDPLITYLGVGYRF